MRNVGVGEWMDRKKTKKAWARRKDLARAPVKGRPYKPNCFVG